MPARVHIPHRIVQRIRIPVQALRVAGVGDDGVGLDEAPEGGVVVAGVVKVQASIQAVLRTRAHARIEALSSIAITRLQVNEATALRHCISLVGAAGRPSAAMLLLPPKAKRRGEPEGGSATD